MASDRPLLEIADRIRAGCNRLLQAHTLAHRQALMERCVAFDRRGLLNTPLRAARFVAIDTETTGFKAYGGDEIVQIALIEYHGLTPTGREFVSLVKPPIPIPPSSTAIHGIDDARVADAPAIDDLVDDLVEFIDYAVIVGHHIAFDLRFINRALQRGLYCRLPQPTVDTMVLYLAHSGRFGHYELEQVAAACDVPLHERHDARGDALTCGQVFARLADRMVGREATVADLIATTRLDHQPDGTGTPAA